MSLWKLLFGWHLKHHCGADEALASPRNTYLNVPKASRHPEALSVLQSALVIKTS